MSITFGTPDLFYTNLEELKSNDRLFLKIGLYIINDDELEAVKYLRYKFGYGINDCKKLLFEFKKTYTSIQIKNLVKYIENEHPEYAI